MFSLLIYLFFITFTTSLTASALIYFSRSHHQRFSARQLLINAVQSAHTAPTSRIGGLAVLLGLAISVALAPVGTKQTLLTIGVAALPLFLAGILEDLGFGVSPKIRLFAAIISACIAVYLLDVWLTNLDLPPIDAAFKFVPIAIAFTVVTCATVSNAFNLIDGLNGLAASIAILSAFGLAQIAHDAGVAEIEYASNSIIAAILGFLVFNYPKGRIFLGDAGAYCIGFLLCWFAIVLAARAPELTPWTLVLVLFWPIADTFLAIYRRRQSGKAPDQPDRLHVHQLVMRALEISWLGKNNRHISNPLATLIILPFAAAPVLTGVALWNQARLAAFATLAYVILFIICYFVGVRMFSAGNKRRIMPPPTAAVLAFAQRSKSDAERAEAAERAKIRPDSLRKSG